MPQVNEIELIERQHFALLVAGAFMSFLVFVYVGCALFAAAFYAFGAGLIFSGCIHAYRITREVPWAWVMAETRLSGGNPTQRGIWSGGIVPGLVVLCIGHWWHPFGP